MFLITARVGDTVCTVSSSPPSPAHTLAWLLAVPMHTMAPIPAHRDTTEIPSPASLAYTQLFSSLCHTMHTALQWCQVCAVLSLVTLPALAGMRDRAVSVVC